MKKFILLAILVIVGGGENFAQKTSLCINEVMQSNVDNVFVDQDYPDSWLELYNPTDKDIDVWHYYLNLENSLDDAYQIVGIHPIVPAHGHLMLYCDKVGNRDHTNFRIDSGKGSVYLFDKGGNLLDNVTLAKMPAANIAYGRVTDGADSWQYEVTPTPGSANNSVGSTKVLPDPVFSISGGVMNTPVSVVITKPDVDLPEDTKLYVTTDGSEPTCTSPTQDEFTFDINSTTVIRSKLISDNALTPRSVTQSYIYHPRTTTLPIISIATDDKHLYSDDIGMLSDNVREGATQANFMYDWRRPINVEMFDTENNTVLFNQVGETEISGGVSRNFAQKSLKLYANKRFGTKRFYGKFWEDKPKVVEPKSFIIRNGGNNCIGARFNDALVQTLFGNHLQDLDWQAYRPVIVYINGEYKGEYGMRERSNEDYVEANYEGLEDITRQEHNAYYSESYRSAFFKELYSAYMSDATTYQQMEDLIDVDNFMGSLIAEMYSGNNDWPHNNVSMWRPNAEGGKWRWILKDMDKITTTNSNYNMFKYLFVEGDGSVECNDGVRFAHVAPSRILYKKMMTYPEFYNVFIDRYSVYLGDFLKPSVCNRMIDDYYAEIIDEIEPTFAVYNMSTMDKFQSEIRKLRRYMNERPAVVYQQMADYFGLGKVFPMKVITKNQNIRINNVGLTENDFDGSYFSNRNLLLSTGADNYGWKMHVNHSDETENDYLFNASEVSIQLADYTLDESDLISVCFEPFEMAKSDFEKKLESLSIDVASLNDLSESLAPVFDEPSCAYLNIVSENGLPSTKGEEILAYVDFYDNNGGYMRKSITLAQQGSDDSNLYKKNLSVTFNATGSEDMDVVFGSWVPQNEFHLKAFYNDGLRGTAEIAYKLYDQIMGIEDGARMTGDAFPCVVYVNGNFQGVYAWQLKKHRKNMGLAKDDSQQVWLDGTLNDKQLFAPETSINWTKFEVRNPKDLYNMDGTEYDGDSPQELLDENCPTYDGSKKKQKRCAEAKTHILALSHYSSELMSIESEGATVVEMRNAIAERFDVDNLVKYMVFSLAVNNYDGFSKKWQWYTLDGQHWAVAPYDCDLTFGYNDDDITKLWTADKSSKKYDYKMENATKDGPMQWIKRYYWEDVKTEWEKQRRNGVLTLNNISSLLNDWTNRFDKESLSKEWDKWSDSPVTDSKDRVEQWFSKRIELEDEYLGYSSSVSFDLSFGIHKQKTVCVPFAFEIPAGLSVYKVLSVDESTLKPVLTKVSKTVANSPYWVIGAYNTTYHLEGDYEYADKNSLTNGALVGTYEDIYANCGDYVTNGSKFERVLTSNRKVVKANEAYVVNLDDAIGSFMLTFDNHRQRTVCVPFSFEIPSGLAVYNVLSVDESTMKPVLSKVVKTEANKPYWVIGSYNTSYNLEGIIEESDESDADYLTNGALVGTYEDLYANYGDYVVNGSKFKEVLTANSTVVSSNTAYVKNSKEITTDDYTLTFENHRQRTLCLPFAFEIPSGLSVFKFTGIVDGAKVLSTVRNTEANKPYLVIGGYNTSFTLSGVVQESIEPLENGILTGTYEDIYVGEGNIVFPHPVSGSSVFYMVGNESVLVRANHAYVKSDPMSAPALTRALNAALNGETTDIDNVELQEDADIIGIFNASGQQIPTMQKGLNIIKYSNGKTDKFILE